MFFHAEVVCRLCEFQDHWLYRGRAKREIPRGPFECENCGAREAAVVQVAGLKESCAAPSIYHTLPIKWGWLSGTQAERLTADEVIQDLYGCGQLGAAEECLRTMLREEEAP